MSTCRSDSPAPSRIPSRNAGSLMARVIELVDARLTPEQRQQLTAAMPTIRWEFPDLASQVQLVATPTALRCVATDADAAAGVVVRMPLAVLDDAAHGRRSLATAFLAGKISVRGMGPARLREFILLVTPLLESYREASREFPTSAAPASDVS